MQVGGVLRLSSSRPPTVPTRTYQIVFRWYEHQGVGEIQPFSPISRSDQCGISSFQANLREDGHPFRMLRSSLVPQDVLRDR
jgi:hypothetical protein